MCRYDKCSYLKCSLLVLGNGFLSVVVFHNISSVCFSSMVFAILCCGKVGIWFW